MVWIILSESCMKVILLREGFCCTSRVNPSDEEGFGSRTRILAMGRNNFGCELKRKTIRLSREPLVALVIKPGVVGSWESGSDDE